MADRLEMLRIFCAAAQAPSFRAAATRLGLSPQAVTRAVQALEALQGEVLFLRSTRHVQLTAAGEALAVQARECLAAVDALFERPTPQDDGRLAGRVRVAAPVLPGRRVALPALLQLAAEHPDLGLELFLSDQRVDVVDDRIDLGVRIGSPRDHRFVARHVGAVDFVVVATPALLARVGEPQHPDELSRFPLSALVDASAGRPWPWYFRDGRQFVPQQPRFLSDDGDAELGALQAGLCLSQVPRMLVSQALTQGTLRTVLDAFAPPPWDLYVYRPQRGPVPERVRAAFDALVAAFLQVTGPARGGPAPH